MKVVIIGGHLSPALSVIAELPKGTEILFIGRKYTFEGDSALSLEYKTIKAMNIPFEELNTGRLQRQITRHTVASLFKLPKGFSKSFSILKKFKPDVVVGFGGYVSIPVIFSASLLRIPIVIHEQTLHAGLANKMLSNLATRICVSWPTSEKYFPKVKTILTGNPIRKFGNSTFPFKLEKNLPIVYVTGGSSGSHFINSLIEDSLEKLLEQFNVIHQTGDAKEFNDFERLEIKSSRFSEKLKKRYVLKKFIDPSDVDSIIKKSDIVVSRSGANTLTEIIYFEKPAVLIPIPFSQNNEQLKNAEFLNSLGLGIVLEQKGLSSEKLLNEIVEIVHNKNRFKLKKEKLSEVDFDNGAKNIVKVIEYASKTKKTQIT